MITIDVLEQRQLFAAGAINTSFGGGDGSVDVRLSPPKLAVSARDMVADDKGRTVIASLHRSTQQITITRLTADGATDATFGKNGYATIATGFNKKASGPFEITVDHAGKILVMFKNRVTRVNESGGVDRKFGAKGSTNLPIFSDVGDLTVDASNRPVIIGTSSGKTGTRGTVVRLGPRGALDTSFGSNGAYKTPVPTHPDTKAPGNAKGTALKVLADGRIVGVADTKTTRQFEPGHVHGYLGVSAFRLNFNGTLDTTYGRKGSTSLAGSFDEYGGDSARFEAFYADGGMIIGTSESGYEPEDKWKSWSRIDANGNSGAIEFEGFSRDYDAPPPVPPFYSDVEAIMSNGKLLLRSSAYPIIRYNKDFTIDTSYTGVKPDGVAAGPVILTAHHALTFTLIYEGDFPDMSQVRVTATQL